MGVSGPEKESATGSNVTSSESESESTKWRIQIDWTATIRNQFTPEPTSPDHPYSFTHPPPSHLNLGLKFQQIQQAVVNTPCCHPGFGGTIELDYLKPQEGRTYSRISEQSCLSEARKLLGKKQEDGRKINFITLSRNFSMLQWGDVIANQTKCYVCRHCATKIQDKYEDDDVRTVSPQLIEPRLFRPNHESNGWKRKTIEDKYHSQWRVVRGKVDRVHSSTSLFSFSHPRHTNCALNAVWEFPHSFGHILVDWFPRFLWMLEAVAKIGIDMEVDIHPHPSTIGASLFRIVAVEFSHLHTDDEPEKNDGWLPLNPEALSELLQGNLELWLRNAEESYERLRCQEPPQSDDIPQRCKLSLSLLDLCNTVLLPQNKDTRMFLSLLAQTAYQRARGSGIPGEYPDILSSRLLSARLHPITWTSSGEIYTAPFIISAGASYCGSSLYAGTYNNELFLPQATRLVAKWGMPTVGQNLNRKKKKQQKSHTMDFDDPSSPIAPRKNPLLAGVRANMNIVLSQSDTDGKLKLPKPLLVLISLRAVKFDGSYHRPPPDPELHAHYWFSRAFPYHNTFLELLGVWNVVVRAWNTGIVVQKSNKKITENPTTEIRAETLSATRRSVERCLLDLTTKLHQKQGEGRRIGRPVWNNLTAYTGFWSFPGATGMANPLTVERVRKELLGDCSSETRSNSLPQLRPIFTASHNYTAFYRQMAHVQELWNSADAILTPVGSNALNIMWTPSITRSDSRTRRSKRILEFAAGKGLTGFPSAGRTLATSLNLEYRPLFTNSSYNMQPVYYPAERILANLVDMSWVE